MKTVKVLVGMSGGVDSSVTALLLKNKGYEVIGGFMKNWSNDACDGERVGECSWKSEERDAMKVCAKLGIEFHTFDFEKEYRKEVYEYMLSEYKLGRTPNPDVLCNKYMKFGHFLRKAKELGCDYVATGHYARVKHTKHKSRLFEGKDKNKDQSYFLARLTQDELKHCLFPIGRMKKSKVRKVARKYDLHIADKKDSQGICFVGKVALSDFLGKRIKGEVGNIVDTSGKILGTHQGQMFYTIGQRHGLNLGGTKPYFVIERRPQTNEVVVGHEDDPGLFKSELLATNIIETWPNSLNLVYDKKVKARIRYRQIAQKCKFGLINENSLRVIFEKPQKAVAPGQFIVFYKGSEVIGSAVIE